MKTSDASPRGARAAALDILVEVTSGRRLMGDAAPEILSMLDPGERARARRLATETLRWSQRSDRLIGRHMRQRPPEDVLNLLRLGAYEVHVAGEAPHGVVSALVTLVRVRTGEEGLARMANAVLRRISEASDWAALPLPELPKPLRKRLAKAYGKDRVAAMEAVHARIPPLDLSPKGNPAEVAQMTGGTLLPTGSVRLAGAGQVSALPGYAEGTWWVQDAAAALPAKLLGAAPGMSVLDLCAAPGGKTMQLAAAGAAVTALDISEARLATLGENLSRTGLAAEIVVADALEWQGGPFDAALLDAPCSATGTIRRHPDLPHAKRDLDLAPLLALQAGLIDRAAQLLKPSGRMIFCTCSLLPDEGEAQVADALGRNGELAIDPVTPDEIPGLSPEWLHPDGTLRITPESWAERGGLDGFFIARLVRSGEPGSGDDSPPRTV